MRSSKQAKSAKSARKEKRDNNKQNKNNLKQNKNNLTFSFDNFNMNFYHGMSCLENNQIGEGLAYFVKVSDFTSFEKCEPVLKEIIKHNLLTYMRSYTNRIYQNDAELQKVNEEFNFVFSYYAKLFTDNKSLAQALHIKFIFNYDAHGYDTALKIADGMIALDQKPEYYHARISIHNANGAYALALQDAKTAFGLAGNDQQDTYQKIIRNFEKKSQQSEKDTPLIHQAVQLLAEEKIEEGVDLIQTALPLTRRDRISIEEKFADSIYYDAIENLSDDLTNQVRTFELKNCVELGDRIIIKATLLLTLSNIPRDHGNAYFYLGKVHFKKGDLAQALDFFKKTQMIRDPNDELIKATIDSVQEKLAEINTYAAEINLLNDKKIEQNTSKKKPKKKKKKKNTKDQSHEASPDDSIKNEMLQLKEKFEWVSTSLIVAIDKKDIQTFEENTAPLNKIFNDATLMKCENESENKKFHAFFTSHFNKLFSEIFSKIQKIEKQDEAIASALYQHLLILNPLNTNMQSQVNASLQKLQKKNQQSKVEKEKIIEANEKRLEEKNQSETLCNNIKKLPKILQFDNARDELRAALRPEDDDEIDLEKIETTYQTYKNIDLQTLTAELKKALETIKSKDLRTTLLSEQKELDYRIQQQKNIETLYNQIKDNQERERQALIKHEIDQLQSYYLSNNNHIKKITALKTLSLHNNPDSIKAELLVLQSEIKNNADSIAKKISTIGESLQKDSKSTKNEFVIQLSEFKSYFDGILKDLEQDKKNYVQDKKEAEQNIRIIEEKELPLKKLLTKAKLLGESKNELDSLKTKIENLQKTSDEIQTLHQSLSVYPYFKTHLAILNTHALLKNTLQRTQQLLSTHDAFDKTEAALTLDEKFSLIKKYQVTWKGGDAQFIGALLYSDSKTAAKVKLKDSDPLIKDDSPSSIAEKLTTEDDYKINNPQPKNPKKKFFKASKHNYVQVTKTISGIKDNKRYEKKIDLTVGHKGTYTEQFVTPVASGRLIIVPSDVEMDAKNYDIIEYKDHQFCIDKTDKLHADFKFAFTHKTCLVTRYNKEIHKNHSYVVVKSYKKMVEWFGKENVSTNAEDKLAGNGIMTICYDKYLNELYPNFSKQYPSNPISCFQEVNSLVINYGFKDPDIKPFLNALIQVLMELDLKVIPKVVEIKDKDREKFIAEVILNLSICYPLPKDVQHFDSEKFNNVVTDAILNNVKLRKNPSKTRSTLIGGFAETLGLTTPESLTTSTSEQEQHSKKFTN